MNMLFSVTQWIYNKIVLCFIWLFNRKNRNNKSLFSPSISQSLFLSSLNSPINTQKNFSEMHAEAPKIQFCRKCGAKLPGDALFCTQCGTKVITDCTVNNNTNINTSAPITNVHNTTQDKNLNRSINEISNESWMCSCGARNNDRSCSVCFKPRPLNSANITSNLPFHFTQDTISNNIPNDKQSEHIPTMQNLINESWVCSCGARNNGRSCSVCYKPRPTQK